jgi:ligand-binding sensor domain-containing protein
MTKASRPKNSGWFRLFWVMLFLPLFPSTVVAQDQSWATIDTYDGLPSNWITVLFFDRDHNLWIGTDRGLALFSSTDQSGKIASRPWIRTFTTKDGLADNHVQAIAQDREGRLWFGTGGGVSCYAGGRFRTFTTKDGLADNHVQAIAQDREGRLWFATIRSGVSQYDGQSFRTVTTKDGLADNHVQAIAQDREGRLWFATIRGGVSRYDGQSFRTFTTKDGLGANDVRAIAQDREGRLWFGTFGGGVSQYDGRSFGTLTTKDGLANDAVQAIAQDQEGRLWFGTFGGGVSRYDGRSFRSFTSQDGLAGNDVRAIAQDWEGRLWFGTYRGGASRYDGQSFRTFTTQHGLADDDVQAIAQDREGRLWFGTYRGGASRYDGQSFRTFATKDGLAADAVSAIAQDREGRLLFGTFSGGVSRYDGQSFRTFTTKDGLAADAVSAIAQDREGRLWFGTFGGGVSRYDGQSFRTFTTKDGLAANVVQAIAQDREGRLWFATYDGGASRYDGQSFHTFATQHGLADDDVRAIAQDREGRLWLATISGGVSRYDGQSFRTFTSQDGLGANDVRAIAQDREGRLWFGTVGGGVSRYDGQSFHTFTTQDGLAANAVQAIAQDGQGRLWFGTAGGVSVYEETEVLGSLSRLVLALEFVPRLISYGSQPREVLWSYRLDDQDAWSQPSRRPAVWRDYWRLGSGRHVLRIRAWDGRANPPRTTVFSFEVSGSEQSIAIATYLLLVGAPIGAGLYWFGKRQVAHWAVQRRFNPYRAGLPVGPDLFTGREDLLEKVMGALANHSVLLTGERRIGKTSFLHALGRRLEHRDDPRLRWVPLYVSLENVPEEQFYAILAQRLIETVGAELPPSLSLGCDPKSLGASPPYGFLTFTRDLKAIAEVLDARAKKPVKIVFLLDEIDRLDFYRPRIKLDLRNLFYARPDLNEWVRTVMSGFRLDITASQGGSPPFNYLLPLTMPPFTNEEARRLIVTPVRGFYAYEPEVVQRIIELSAGRPFVIQTVCWRLIEQVLGARRRTVTKADLDMIEQRTLEDVQRIIESGSSRAGFPTSLPEALERIAELERQVASLRPPPGQTADNSPPSPPGSRSLFTEEGVERSP